MKLGLISDLHGDASALDRALSLLDDHAADPILCAGDLVGYGPEPDRVVRCLRARQIVCVRGNHDRWALGRAPDARDPSGGSTPSAETRAFLADLPPLAIRILAGRVIVIAHGIPGDDTCYLNLESFSTAQLDAMLDDLGADVLVVGHTHQPAWFRSRSGGLIVNPGSVLSCVPGVRSSQTCAVLDLKTEAATFLDLRTGAVRAVDPWSADRRPAI
ncbi:MAG: hypothetical protein KatS3mg108_0860 [Isosphaeraceae bacterium]|nr:MAG: hypothetical protein KatS3mg108_0860 [Isosphaeraceae bacterium]